MPDASTSAYLPPSSAASLISRATRDRAAKHQSPSGQQARVWLYHWLGCSACEDTRRQESEERASVNSRSIPGVAIANLGQTEQALCKIRTLEGVGDRGVNGLRTGVDRVYQSGYPEPSCGAVRC